MLTAERKMRGGGISIRGIRRSNEEAHRKKC